MPLRSRHLRRALPLAVVLGLLAGGAIATLRPAGGPAGDPGRNDGAALAGRRDAPPPGLVGRGGAAPDPAAAPAGTFAANAALGGLALGEDGQPLADEVVSLHALESSTPPTWEEMRAPSLPSVRTPASRPPALTVRTGPDGTFAIPPDFARGSGRAVVAPRGSHAGGCRWWRGRVSGTTPVTIVVRRGRPLEGRVVDREGAPVGGGRVFATSVDELDLFWESAGAAVAPDGRFRLAVADRLPLTFRVEGDGGIDVDGLYARRASDGTYTLTLPGGGGRVEGIVTSAGGAPAAGCTVRLQARLLPRGALEVTTRTDTTGRFRIGRLPPLMYVRLEAWPSGGPAARMVLGDLEADAHQDVALSLLAVRRVHVRVRDDAGGPVPEAWVRVTWEARHQGPWDEGRDRACIRADEQGAVVLEGVPSGHAVGLKAWAPGWAPARDQAKGVTLPPDGGRDPVAVELRVVPQAPLAVRVVDGQGSPVVGARVRWGGWFKGPDLPGYEEQRRLPMPLRTTDARGEALLPGWGPGTEAWLLVEHPDFAPAEPRLAVTTVAPAPLEVVLTAPCFVEGILVDDEDRPRSGWTVHGETEDLVDAETLTDTAGRFRVGPLPAGTVTVAPHVPYGQGGLLEDISEACTLRPGETVTGVRLQLRGVHHVGGWVEGPDGVPIEGCQLGLHGDDPAAAPLAQARTDADGAFVLVADRLPREVVVRAHGAAPMRVPRNSRGVRLVQDLPRRPLTLEVRQPDGEPVPHAQATITQLLEGEVRTAVDVTLERGVGIVDLPDVDGAELRIDIGSPVGSRQEALNLLPLHVRLPVPASGRIEVRMAPGREIRGRVVDLEGQALEGVQVAASVADRVAGRYYQPVAQTDAEGRFALVGLYDLEHALRARDASGMGRRRQAAVVRVAPGGPDVVLRLGRRRSLEGLVTDEGGTPLAGVVVLAWGEPGTGVAFRHGATTDAHGRFAFRDVLPLEEVIHVQVPDTLGTAGAWWPSEVLALGDPAGDVVIRLAPAALVEGVVLRGDLDADDLTVVARPAVDAPEGEGALPRYLPTASVDGEGRFRLGPLHPRAVELHVTHQHLDAPGPALRVQAPARDVRLEPPSARPIRGQVPGAAEGTAVAFVAQDGGAVVTTRGDASFVVYAPPGATGSLFVHEGSTGRYAWLEGVTADGGPYTLRLVAGVSIRGRLEGVDRTPPHARVSVGAHGPFGWVAGHADVLEGTFEIPGLPPGSTWEVHVTVGEGRATLRVPGVAAGARDVVVR